MTSSVDIPQNPRERLADAFATLLDFQDQYDREHPEDLDIELGTPEFDEMVNRQEDARNVFVNAAIAAFIEGYPGMCEGTLDIEFLFTDISVLLQRKGREDMDELKTSLDFMRLTQQAMAHYWKAKLASNEASEENTVDGVLGKIGGSVTDSMED